MAVPRHYPEGVQRALLELTSALQPLPHIRALAVYGSLARGTFREGVSDLNLAVVLEHAAPDTLARLREPLQAAQRAERVEPFFVTTSELERLTDVFPIKLLDIQRHHDLILGSDVFSPLKFQWHEVRLRAEQEFRNHQLRLRRVWALSAPSSAGLGVALKRSSSSVAIAVETLFWLKGNQLASTGPEALIEQAALAFALDPSLLSALARFKTSSAGVDLAALFQGLMAVTDRLVEVVDRLEAPT